MSFRKIPKKSVVIVLLLLCVCAAFGYFLRFREGGKDDQPQFATAPQEKENMFLFVPSGKRGLEKKALVVKATSSERAKADILFQELRKAKAIPASAKLQELAFGEGGVLYLDISRDVVTQQADARGEIQLVYALVNSFIASFRDVNRVQLLVDGRPLYTFFGTVYTYAPLPFNNDLQEE